MINRHGNRIEAIIAGRICSGKFLSMSASLSHTACIPYLNVGLNNDSLGLTRSLILSKFQMRKH